MADYSKMKNAELEALLKQRGLPHTGKKADMVARLQEADKANSEKPAETSTAAAAAPPEDEIDWDDDTTDAKPAAAAASTEASATAIKAGGKGPVANPQAVPNQVADIDPSKTDDLAVKAPEGDGEAADAPAAAQATEAAEVEKKDFTSGLKETTLDEELEKRKARAKKFGLPEDDEAAKLLERSKKFGTDPAAAPRGLNEALPERRPKRGRETGDEGGRGNFKKRGGRGGRFQGRRGGGGGGERRGNEQKSNPGAGGSWMNADDKAKAEARKARFAASAPSAAS